MAEEEKEKSAEKDKELQEKYLQPPQEGAATKEENSLSPLKSCPKSPVKRMKNLEQKENNENQENIETTYQKVHGSQEEEVEDPNQMSETSGMEAKFAQEIKFGKGESKSILGSQRSM